MSMLGGIFNVDSKFSIFMSKLFDLMVLNFIFIIMCIPIITIGANVTATYYVTLRMSRNEDSYVWKSYWKSFRQNFKQSTIIWLITLGLGLLLVADIYLTNHVVTGVLQYIRYFFYCLALIYFFVMLYVFPIQSRFYNKVRYTLRNSFLFAIRHLPYTLLMAAVVIGPTIVATLAGGAVFSYFILVVVLFGFSGTAYINSIFLNKIFKKYIPEEGEESNDSTQELEAADATLESITEQSTESDDINSNQ
ncbi:MAG: DUF624 domain-containing protein [Lachnospiraceae bacterium]|nr:DUF624 domain-containing protein [Lachnospiraceae bacterium]